MLYLVYVAPFILFIFTLILFKRVLEVLYVVLFKRKTKKYTDLINHINVTVYTHELNVRLPRRGKTTKYVGKKTTLKKESQRGATNYTTSTGTYNNYTLLGKGSINKELRVRYIGELTTLNEYKDGSVWFEPNKEMGQDDLQVPSTVTGGIRKYTKYAIQADKYPLLEVDDFSQELRRLIRDNIALLVYKEYKEGDTTTTTEYNITEDIHYAGIKRDIEGGKVVSTGLINQLSYIPEVSQQDDGKVLWEQTRVQESIGGVYDVTKEGDRLKKQISKYVKVKLRKQ